jgi:hypothetical protein
VLVRFADQVGVKHVAEDHVALLFVMPAGATLDESPHGLQFTCPQVIFRVLRGYFSVL